MTQSVLGRRNDYTLVSGGVVRLTLLQPAPRLLWRLGYDELTLRVVGPFPTPRDERLRGTIVTLATTPQGRVLQSSVSGIVSPGPGGQYIERAAAAFLPRLPQARAAPGATWTDTLAMTEVVSGLTARIETVVTYRVSEISALAGRAVLPIAYEGRITVRGSGTIDGSRVSLSGGGTLDGHYLYDPADRIFNLHAQEQVLDSTLTIVGPSGTPVEIPSRQILRARAERLF